MTEVLFRAIKSFVNDMADVYSSDIHALALYDRLLQKTTLMHTEAVEKHIEAFRKFFDVNKSNIIENTCKFDGIIEYSQKVFIDMNNVYKVAANDTEDVIVSIYRHLLTISALLDPSGGAKEKLISINANANTSIAPIRFEGDTNEENFLNGIMETVGKSVNSDNVSSPHEAMEKIMGSGIINELVSNISVKMSTGNLDIGKMFGAVQKMVGTLTKDSQGDPQLQQMMGMMNMMGSTFKK